MQLTVAQALGLLVSATLSQGAVLPYSPPASPIKRTTLDVRSSPEKMQKRAMMPADEDLFGGSRKIARRLQDRDVVDASSSMPPVTSTVLVTASASSDPTSSVVDSSTVSLVSSSTSTSAITVSSNLSAIGSHTPGSHRPGHGKHHSSGSMSLATHISHTQSGNPSSIVTQSTPGPKHPHGGHHHSRKPKSQLSSSSILTSSSTSNSVASLGGATAIASGGKSTATTKTRTTTKTKSKSSTKVHSITKSKVTTKATSTKTKPKTTTSTKIKTTTKVKTHMPSSSSSTVNPSSSVIASQPSGGIALAHSTHTKTKIKTKVAHSTQYSTQVLTKTKTKTHHHSSSAVSSVTSSSVAVLPSGGSAAFSGGQAALANGPIKIAAPILQTTVTETSGSVSAIALYGQAQEGYLYASWLDALNQTHGEYVSLVKHPKALVEEKPVVAENWALALNNTPTAFSLTPLVANGSIPVYAQTARALLQVLPTATQTNTTKLCAGFGDKNGSRAFVGIRPCHSSPLIDFLLSQDIMQSSALRLAADFGYVLQADSNGTLIVSTADKAMSDVNTVNLQLSFTTQKNLTNTNPWTTTPSTGRVE